MSGEKCEGTIYVKIDREWKKLFCWIRNGRFQAYDRQRVVSVSDNTKREAVIDVSI
jgi:hypothetical protein